MKQPREIEHFENTYIERLLFLLDNEDLIPESIDNYSITIL